MTEFLKRKNLPDLAYIKYEGKANLPCVMFLGGFRSNMMGSKASFLNEYCIKHQQTYICFDYSGHGQSQGHFEDLTLSDWLKDAHDILNECTKGDVILVGSSMGGWISLLLAQEFTKNVKAVIGIAAAPDFTTWIENGMSSDQYKMLNDIDYFELPSDYDAPYVITKKLLADGKNHILLDKNIYINKPVRLLQGKKDEDVSWHTAENIKEKITGEDVKIIYREEGNHSLSTFEDLEILGQVVHTLSKL